MLNKTDIEKYFIAEKQLGTVLIIVGAIALVSFLYALFICKTQYCKGFSIPLCIVGFALIFMGIVKYNKSDNIRVGVIYALDMNPELIKNKEIPRMKTVNKTSTIIKYSELILMVLGIAFYFYFKSNTDKPFLTGFAVALIFQAIIVLSFIFFSENKNLKYTQQLKEFVA
ncbi:MAG: hypothetical protein H3C56_01245 [Chitinophagaceae bacterium]|nr:hypothetical protein [Chitinophagaceae bacterium]